MVRAIDLQTSILQSSQVEKIQQIQQQHADMQQKYFQLRLSEEDRLAHEKVNNSEEAERTKIRRQEEKGDQRKGGNPKQQFQAELLEDENGEPQEEGGHINITV